MGIRWDQVAAMFSPWMLTSWSGLLWTMISFGNLEVGETILGVGGAVQKFPVSKSQQSSTVSGGRQYEQLGVRHQGHEGALVLADASMIPTMLQRVILPGIGGAWSNKINDVLPRLWTILGVLDILHADGAADYLSTARGMRKKSEAPCVW